MVDSKKAKKKSSTLINIVLLTAAVGITAFNVIYHWGRDPLKNRTYRQALNSTYNIKYKIWDNETRSISMSNTNPRNRLVDEVYFVESADRKDKQLSIIDHYIGGKFVSHSCTARMRIKGGKTNYEHSFRSVFKEADERSRQTLREMLMRAQRFTNQRRYTNIRPFTNL